MTLPTSFNWQENFPYPEPRPIQEAVLEEIRNNWDKYDVWILQAPTAFGKSSIAKTFQNWGYSVSYITPTNQLVHQYLDEFPDTPTLHRLDSYHCVEWDRPCPSTKSKLLRFCRGCKCASDLSTAKYRRGPGVYNYHTYLAHKLYRDVLIVDEAHNLLSVIRDRLALKLWKHDFHYPQTMYQPHHMQKWIESLPEKIRKKPKIQKLLESVSSERPEWIAQRTEEWFAGKGTIRGEPELRDVIKLLPVDVKGAPPMFWPQDVKKIVLLSATINQVDIEQLGLAGRRVVYVKCESPIPADRRPILIDPVASVSRENIPQIISPLAGRIHAVAEYHSGEKGLVHATYQLAGMLREHLEGNPRFMFHTRENKQAVYEEFRNSPTEEGRILVASGMYEGIDLPEDFGRWQVVAKIPWPSLGSPAVRYQAEDNPSWYNWEVWKCLIQACGRICRTPEDYGVTYIIDGSFWRLWEEASDMIPDWFRDALQFIPISEK